MQTHINEPPCFIIQAAVGQFEVNIYFFYIFISIFLAIYFLSDAEFQ